MPVILVGLNHNSAPVSLREQLSLSGCALDMALEEFRQTLMDGPRDHPTEEAQLTEAVFLSTCNRLELYVACTVDSDHGSESDLQQSWQPLVHFLANLHGIDPETLAQHLYFEAGADAIQHLMQVTCGLDSLILGEPQIIGQVSTAYRKAQAAQATGPILSHLFNQAIHTGKRARSETDISRHTTSVSHAAAGLALQELGELSNQRILVVGAGEMAKLVAQAVMRHSPSELTIINRTLSSATELAALVGGTPAAWHQIDHMLVEADVVITATGAPHVVIDRDRVEQILPERAGRSLFFIDIAVPRDVDEAVGNLSAVVRYDVDNLRAVVDQNIAQRQAALPKVQAIIDQELAAMLDWLSQRKVVPVIVDMRAKAHEIAAAEIAEAKRRLHPMDDQSVEVVEDVITRLAHRLVNKLMHDPVVQLKSHAASGNGHEYAFMLRDLFKLSTNDLPVM